MPGVGALYPSRPRLWRLLGAGMRAISARKLMVGVLLLAVLWFSALEVRGLFRPDEGRYAEIPRQMVASGDWVTPRLNGLKYFEKPPLQYWATAAIYSVFGYDEWTARLWPAALGFIGVLVCAAAAAWLFPGTSMLTVLSVIGGSWGYFLASQYVTLDMGLSFFLTLALIAFLNAFRSHQDARGERNWMLLAWASTALAVLSKGPIGAVLPALAVGAYVLVQRDLRLLKSMYWVPGLALFAALVVPWFVLVSHRNPEFFHFFFIHEHLERYLSTVHERTGPWWYFVPVIIGAMFPWTPVVPAALRQGWRMPQDGALHSGRFLVLWSVVIVGFFSASQSKLPAYVLPALPALLLLVAGTFETLTPRQQRWPLYAVIAAAVVLGSAGLAAGHLFQVAAWGALLDDYKIWVLVAALVLAATAWAAARLLRARRVRAYVVVLGLGSLCAAQILMAGLHAVDEYYSAERLVEQINPSHASFAPAQPFYSIGGFDQSVPFYLGRPVTVVGARGELAMGIDAEPDKWLPSIDAFRREWSADGEAYALMSIDRYNMLRADGLPMHIIARDMRRVIVAR